MKDKEGKPENTQKGWLFRSREGKGDHLLSSTEETDDKGKKTTIFKKVKPGNSNN